MSSCPNKSHPAWKALVEQTGSEIEAYKEYINNDFSIPYTGVELSEREIKPGVSELFDSNPELASIGTPEQYSDYVDSIFPNSKVKDVVYRGGEKQDVRLYKYWTNNKTEAYMYAKAHITKGGNITERNPISVIVKNFKTYINNKYGENTFESLNTDESNFLNQISETEYELQLPSWYKKDVQIDNLDRADFNAIKTLRAAYDSIKIENEDDLDKPYVVNDYASIKRDYDNARKQLEKYFNREEVGKITTAVLNIKNPYKEEIRQEDLQNDRDAYKNGHDGAFLSDGDHFLVRSNTDQIHELGDSKDIEGFKKFVGSDKTMLHKEGIPKAPNGEESKLYKDLLSVQSDPKTALRLWNQVYTPSFKSWFGDWEKGEGSKVVDDNGEPLLVYHGSGEKFDTFKPNKFGLTYFTPNLKYSQVFAQRQKDGIDLLKSIYNEQLKSLTAVQDALDVDKGYPWLYNVIERLSKDTDYTAKQIVDTVYKNINDPSVFEQDFERMYIQDSGDEGADYYDKPETEEEREAYRNYEKKKEKDAIDKENEVYRLLALSDKTLDIINALENDVSTEESDIVRNAEKYGEKASEETIYPVFLNIRNPQYEEDISNENIDYGIITLSETADGLIGKDSPLYTKLRGEDISYDNVDVYAVYEPNQIKSAFNKGTYSAETGNVYQQKKGTETSTASPQTISMIKDFLKRIGVDIKPMQQIVVNGIRQDANGAALIMQKLIQVMEGKEASALPEEAMHFAVEIIKQTNPALYKTLLREINNYAILKKVFADYATDPAYQTKDGKPDVIKLKEEAIAKVLADTIIKKTEGVIEKPENLQKTLNWWEKITEWLKSLFLKSGFDQAAMDIISGKSIGTANDIRAEIDAAFLQKAGDPQTVIFNKIKEVASRIKPKKVMVDGEEVEKYFIDGKMIDRRVTQLAKDWYSRQRDQKDLTKSEYQTALDDLKKEKGTLGHKYLELAFNMFIDENGFVRAVPLDEATAFSKIPVAERAVFNVLKDNLQERINTINAEGGKKVRFMSEVTIYDPKRSIAGTVDFLAITPDGKTYVLDWKFMAIKTEKFKDIPWYNVNSWRIQMEQYKLILRSVYGVKANDFVQTRMIPIQAIYKGGDPRNNVLPTLDEVKIGDVTVKNIAEDFLLPLSLAEETTGTKKLDTLIGKLNAVYKKFSERRVLPSEKLDKNEQLNTLFQAIRHLQMKNDLRPLLRQAKILNIQINKIIDRYNNEFKGKAASSFTEQQINEFSADLITAQDSLRTYITLDVDLEFLFPKTLTEEDIALKNDLIATAGAARTLMNDIEGEDGVINEFAQDIVAKSESVNSLLSSEKIIKGFTRLFGSTSTLQNRSIQLLYKKANKAFYYSGTDTLAENRKLLALKEAFDKWARGKGLTSKNYFSLIKKKGKNELIDEFNPEFFSILKKKIETKDYEWVRQNINVVEYNQALSKKLEEEIQRILDKPRVFDNPADIAKMDLYNQTKNLADLPSEMIFEIREKQALYNTSTTESPGWLLYDLVNKHPAEKWMSKEWKELHAKDASGNYINKPALDFFNYIREKNEEYRDLGYIRRDSARVFLPFVRKSFAEKLVTKGQLRLGEQFFRSISIDEGDVGFGQIDPLTGKPIDVIPKYFTTAVEGEMSEDLFKTMAFYNESAIRYKYLKQIENQLQLISGVERNKKAIATSFFGKTDYVDDVLQYTPNNNENSKLYDDMMKSIVYGQKFLTSETFDQLLGKLGTWGETLNKKLGISIFPEGLSQRQLSVNKILNNLNNTFQLSSLGLNLLSASSNFFGGNAQSIINSGKYFTKGDYLASELEIFTQRLNVPNQKKILAALEYFLPLTENYNREFAKKLSLSTMTQESLQDGLMFLMRKSDWNVQTANFLSFLKNSIVENGRVINVREFLRGQPKYENIYAGTVQQRKALENDFEEDVKKLIEDKGILKVSQIVNNELVIPGVDQKSDSVVDFRRKVQSLTKDALGNLSEDDVRMINMSVYGKSFMVFKNWIPRLVDVRMGNLKYNSASDAYEWGRTRMVFRILKQDLWKSIRNLHGSLVANERGVEFMRDLYEKKKYDYERDTGKELDMTEAQFIDLVRGNIKSQVIDLIFYASMIILVAGIKDLPDDEEDPAVKNQYRYLIKMADKFKDEISYFYDPTALLKTVSGNVFPAISLIENFRKGFGNFFVENWAIMEGDQETVDDVYVIKYLMKTFPFTNQMVGYLPMFYPEVAKDLGIKMQKNYGIK